MLENGFEVEVPAGVLQQLAGLERHPPLVALVPDVRDLRRLSWSSIDNDTSRDLDQLEVAERLPDGTIKVMVAIADVDAFVPKDSPIDQFAASQTTTVYTGGASIARRGTRRCRCVDRDGGNRYRYRGGDVLPVRPSWNFGRRQL
jgi:exoribonuclease-2